MKTLARGVYHLVPASVRRGLEHSGLYGRVYEAVASSPRLHDWFYDAEYYDSQLDWLERASVAFAEEAVRRFAPGRVFDVGCGQGHYLAAFASLGVAGEGVELAEEAYRRCVARGLSVRQVDLTAAEGLNGEADLVYSIEVAEHLPERFADHWVGLLTAASRQAVVITAAGPGQSGKNHFNCRPKAYWVEKFERHGFRFNRSATEVWQAQNAEQGLPTWLRENLLVLERA